ncbi:MAG: YqgE/AlgH family protein [bacterium]
MADRSFRGHFLLARPSLTDPNFSRTVVYIFDHSPEGAAGVVINRPSKLTIEELSVKIYGRKIEWDKPIHVGGPVGGPLLMIHRDANYADEEVAREIYRTGDPDKISELLLNKHEPSLLVANYAGWGPLQLEAEIKEGSWEVAPAPRKYVFWTGVKDLWDVMMGEINAKEVADILKIQRRTKKPYLN